MKWVVKMWKKFIGFFIRHKVVLVPVTVSEVKVDFNIERFERAIRQCENPAKKAELKANLKYWASIKAVYTISGAK